MATIEQLITELEKWPSEMAVKNGFADPHSYRGYYDCLAVEPAEATVASMLADLSGAVEKSFTGYKGGDFRMHSFTSVYESNYGDTGDELSVQWLQMKLQMAKIGPVDLLCELLLEDRGYHLGWHSNLAVSVQDAGGTREIGQEAARRFIGRLFSNRDEAPRPITDEEVRGER